MTRKRFFSSLGALCLSAALILSSTTYVQAEEDAGAAATTQNAATVTPGDATVTPGDTGSGTVTGGDIVEDETPGDSTELTKLATPTGLKWSDYWQAQWNGVPEAEGYYGVEVYKDGSLYYSTQWSGLRGESVSINTSCHMYDSGTYKFRIKAMADYDSEQYISGDWSDFSAEKVYVKPSKVLGTTTPYFGDDDGYIYFNSVEGAGGYRVYKYYKSEDSSEFYERGSSWSVSYGTSDEAGRLQRWYVGHDMDDPGQYYFTVQALSGNIDLIANGSEGAPSGIFDTASNAGVVSDKMDAAIQNSSSAAEAVQKITADNTDFALQNAMQNDATVLQKVADLDARHMAETGVSVENKVSSEASAYVDVNNIKLVGAALSADSGKIGLDVTVPAKKEYVNDKHYKNSVQLDIKLVNDGTEVGDLKMPINITMPIPAGLDASKLVILHYSADGSFESLKLRVNGDGTVTFTVTHFSNFVFAETNDGGTTGGNDDGGNTGGGGSTTATPAPAATSPKTADRVNCVVPMLLFAAGFFGLAAVVCKKKEY